MNKNGGEEFCFCLIRGFIKGYQYASDSDYSDSSSNNNNSLDAIAIVPEIIFVIAK